MTYSVTNNTEAALAEAFAAKHADKIKYVAASKKWFVKTTDGWEPDLKLRSANFISAVERVCRFQPAVAAKG